MFATASEYFLFYYIVITLCLIGKITLGRRFNRNIDTLFAILISILLGCTFGSRPIDIGSDTFVYSTWFNDIKGHTIGEVAKFAFGSDPIIRMLFWIFGKFASVEVTLGFVSFLFTFLCYYFSKRICETAGYGSGFVLFLITLYSFTAFNCEINIIRAGLGIGFWLIFTINLFKKDLKSTIIYGVLAFFTHFSTIIFIILAILAYKIRFNINKYMLLTMAILVLSFIGISVLQFINFDIFNLEKTDHYVKNISKTNYVVGFRFTFAIYNIVFLTIPFFLKKYMDELEKYYFRLYALSTMIFFLWFAVPYSDRIGSFSWFLIPMLVYVPLVRCFGSNSMIVTLSCLIWGIINYCIVA